MTDPALGLVSINAFAAVLVVLAGLAAAVWTLTRVFPPPPAPEAPARGARPGAAPVADEATVAAIQAAVAQALAGGRVTRIVPLDDAAKGPP